MGELSSTTAIVTKHKTAIQWTHIPGYIGATWNVLLGCAIRSPGCTFCYAMNDAYRKGFNPKLPRYHGLTHKVNGHAVWTGATSEAPVSTWELPLKWKKPHAIFVEDMSDLFFGDAEDRAKGFGGFSDDQIDRVLATAVLCPRHIFLILTKRSKRMLEYFNRPGREDSINGRAWSILGSRVGSKIVHGGNWRRSLPLPNVWLAVSTEDQRRANERIPDLLRTPAAKRFISAEPLLGPIDLREAHTAKERLPRIDWVIVGGESGLNARAHDLSWDRDIRIQCKKVGVAYFEKQLGRRPRQWLPAGPHEPFHLADKHGGDMSEWPLDLRIREFPTTLENTDAR